VDRPSDRRRIPSGDVVLEDVDELGHQAVAAKRAVELAIDEHRRNRVLERARQADPVVGVKRVNDEDEVMIITSQGKIIRMPAGGISVIGRSTQGVRVIDVGEGDQVVSVARLPRPSQEPEAVQ
jgi:DNA gyrase/topoisomerase IV subunit A